MQDFFLRWLTFNAIVAVAFIVPHSARAADEDGPAAVKVFILAGQSNMEGKAANSLFDYQANAELEVAGFVWFQGWNDKYGGGSKEYTENMKEDPDAWRRVGSDEGYHYYGSAIWFTRIGREAGEVMIDLIENQQ